MGQSVSVQEPAAAPAAPAAPAPPLHLDTAKPLNSSSNFNSKSSSSFNFGQQDQRSTDDEQVSKQVVKAADQRKNQQLPHNYEHIIKDSDSTIQNDKLHDQLHSGVFLNNKTKKYWIEDSGANGFMLFARDLTVTWGDDRCYWQWSILKDTTSVDDEGLVEVAELLNVCWLEVHGKFETWNLTPETIYEVVFVVMIKDPAYGWETPVNLRLVLPDGQTQQHKENLSSKMRCQWIQLQAGEFYLTSTSKKGTMEFSLFEYDGGQWKKGILIKGVIIRPKK